MEPKINAESKPQDLQGTTEQEAASQPIGVEESPSDEAGAEPENLGELLDEARNEARENYERLLRVSAEFDNYKKRAAREVQEYRRFANESLLQELLPIIDNLERALAVPADAQNEKGLREGLDLTLKQIHKLLERFGVSAIEAEGKPFDPVYHQAMMQEHSDEVPENTVLRQMQKGYAIHDRLLRPAMVVVAKAAAKGGETAPGADTAEAQS
ncbi:MAG: nucleotide exchange factor GrpE [Desulfobacteraceae bacterium]|jgi:molecular chaperone GrpE|nr:nucleotide exchange factor GrpE [Desulfobacteraceae bacterium]